ncbi:MAG: class I SAM-dependent methyltransferase [Candidatus Sericytochromatia bacterium]
MGIEEPRAATEAVREQYAHFPFPPLALGALAEVQPPQANAFFGHWYARQQWPHTPLRILDAGCGTGFSTLKLAEANPEAQIVAVDFSAPSLAVAQKRLHAAGQAERVQWVEADLQQLPDLGQFDYIHSSGVIHHLPNPGAGLAALRRHLSPQGVAYFMVYAGRSRHEIAEIQGLVRMLWRQPDNWQEGLSVCRTLLHGLPAEHPLKRFHMQTVARVRQLLGPEAAASEAFWVDTYLQRCEWRWTQPEWFDLLAQTGWGFARWLDPESWELSRYLPGLPDYVQALTLAEQWALADRLRPPHHFALYVTAAEQPARRPPLLLNPSAVPVPFGFVRRLPQALDNGRGTQLSFNGVSQACWEALDGQLEWRVLWQKVRETHPELSDAQLQEVGQQWLDWALVAQR